MKEALFILFINEWKTNLFPFGVYVQNDWLFSKYLVKMDEWN